MNECNIYIEWINKRIITSIIWKQYSFWFLIKICYSKFSIDKWAKSISMPTIKTYSQQECSVDLKKLFTN